MAAATTGGSGAPDIEARTFEFALRVIKVCLVLDKQPGVRRTLGNQLLKSGAAITAESDEITRILGAIVRTARRNHECS